MGEAIAKLRAGFAEHTTNAETLEVTNEMIQVPIGLACMGWRWHYGEEAINAPPSGEYRPKTFSEARAPYACFVGMLRFACFLFPVLLVATSVGAQSLTPVGVWLHPNERIQVGIVPCGDRLCGKIVWFRWPNDAQGLPLVDLKNADPALRTRPLLGLTILYGLRRTGERTWEDGKIYNPDDGVNYQAFLSIQDDGTLRVRAFVLFPIFGNTLIWTRIR